MRFAVSLMRLLCAAIAGAVLVAYLFFSANYEQTGLEGSHTAAIVSMILLIGALITWGVVTIIGDMWMKNVENQLFYSNLAGEIPSVKAKNSVDNKKFETFVNQLKTANADHQQSLTSGFQELTEKLDNLAKMEKNDANVVEKFDKIGLNMAQLQGLITQLQTAVEQQSHALSQFSTPQAKTQTPTNEYPQLTEEANYPESVIDYAQSEDKNVAPDTKEEISVIPEIVEDISLNTTDENYTDEPLEHFLDTSGETDDLTVVNQIAEEQPTPPTIEAEAMPEIVTKDVDLGADNQFSTTSEENDIAKNQPEIVTEETDLGADNPFGTPTISTENNIKEPFFEPEHHTIDLGADNPFGTSVDASMDISAIEPTTQNKKNEPNLDKIFNDELASELADLEILNGKPTEKTQDEIDLEQFFASHRKSLG